jgi:hypothetical protein
LSRDPHLEALCNEFSVLGDAEKDYILGISENLALFLHKKGKNLAEGSAGNVLEGPKKPKTSVILKFDKTVQGQGG